MPVTDPNATKDMILRVLSETNQKLDLLLILSYVGHSLGPTNEGRTEVPEEVRELLSMYLRLSNEAQAKNLQQIKTGGNGLTVKMKKFLKFCLKRGDKLPTRIEDGYDTATSPTLRALCFYTKEFQMLVSKRLSQAVKDLESGRPNRSEDEIDELLDYELQIMSRLENELESLQDDRNEKVSITVSHIENIESEIQDIENNTESIIENARRSCELEIANLKLKSDQEISDLKSSEILMRDRLTELMKENNAREKQLKMTLSQSASEDLEILLKEKNKMERQASSLKRQYDVIMEERERLRLENERIVVETAQQLRAVTMIQARWRGYVARLKLRAKLRKNRKAKKANSRRVSNSKSPVKKSK